MITLYSFFRSSAAFRVRIALNLKQLPYEQRPVHLRRGEQRAPAFLKLNPLGLVPAMIDGERVLTQSMTILEYLDEAYPNIPILPNTIDGRARVRALADAIACDIHPIDNLRVLTYLSAELKADQEAVGRWFQHWIRLGFEAIETMLGDGATGRFCHGDEPGLADICLVPQVFNSQRYDMDLGAYPTLKRVFDACMQLPAFEAARPEKQPDAE